MKYIHTQLLLLAVMGSVAAEEPAAQSDQIAAMEKIADLALVPPKLNTSPLPEYDYDKLDYGIRQPNARFHIRRLASGRILLIKHGDAIDSHQGRVMLSAWLSEDDGKSWQGGLVLDERKGISYPDGFQAPDGTLYISYDRNRSTDGEILLARFTEADILAKKLVGTKSKLKMLICRPLAGDVAKRKSGS